MWGIIEINTSIVVVNLPTLMPILDWLLEMRKRVKDYMARATRAETAVDGMLLRRETPRRSISAFGDDPENPQATYGDESYELENQARRPSASAAEEMNGQSFGYGITSSGSLQERESSVPFHVTNA